MAMTAISTDVTVRSQKAAAKTAQQTAALNAREKRQQAMQEIEVAGENARRKTRENRRIIAANIAANAANGLQMEGTPLAVLGETAMQLERDILDISFDAQSRQRALLRGASMDIWSGSAEAAALNNKATASAISGMASAASGAGKATGQYLG